MTDNVIKAGIQIQADVVGREEIEKLEQDIRQTNTEAQKLQKTAQTKTVVSLDIDNKIHQEIDGVKNALNDFGQSGHKMTPIAQGIGKIGIAAAGAVGGLVGLKQGLTDILNVTQEYQAIATRFSYAFGGVEAGAAQLAFVREEANRLGLEMMGAANGYAQFATAAKDLNISTEQTQSIFKGVASAAATMGLSAEDANGVFLALSQIAGKGKVSMEELRGQLGERLAPAMSIAAQAMGVTTAELEKMVENGLAAETFLPRFGAALEQAFGSEAADNAESLSGQINLLKNSYNEFLISLGEGGVAKATVTVLKDIGKALEAAQAKFDEFIHSADGELLEQGLTQFWDLLKQIGSTVIEVFKIAQDNFSDFAGVLSSSSQEIGLIQSLLMGVNLTVAALNDGFKAIGIVFNVFSGSVKSLISSIFNLMSKVTFGSWSEKLKQESQELREESDKNFQAAHESAMNFESQIGKTINQMRDNADQVKTVYDNAQAAAKTAIDETAKAEAGAQALSQTYRDAQTAVSAFGLDMRAAMNEPTPAMAEMSVNLDKLVSGFDELQSKGVDTGLLIQQAIGKMVDSAGNRADIDAVKAQIESLGESGKLSADAMANAFLAADVKMAEIAERTSPVAAAFKQLGVESRATTELQIRQAETALQTIQNSGQATEAALEQARRKVQELKNALDPTAQAFERLGIKTKEALAQAAAQQQQDFEAVKRSGLATQADLQRAFQATANAMLASGDTSQRAWVQSQAAAYDYTVVVDQMGKANLQAAADTATAAAQQITAHNQVAAAAQQAAAAQSDAGSETAQQAEQTARSVQHSGKKLSEFGQFIQAHWQMQYGVISSMGEALSVHTANAAAVATGKWKRYTDMMRSVQSSALAVTQRLNDEMERGGNIAEWLAKAESLAMGNADKLDKTTLSNLTAAIDKARAKMKAMSDEAANTKKALEKQLLNAQGNTGAVAEMEQREALKELQTKLDAAQKTGNREAVEEYRQSIELQKQIYQVELDKQRAEAEQAKRQAEEAAAAEAKAKQEAEQTKREQAQRGRETSRPANHFTLPEIKLPEPTLDLSALDLSQVQIDTGAIAGALAERDHANLEQIKAQLPKLINDLMPQIAGELIRQIQKDAKRSE